MFPPTPYQRLRNRSDAIQEEENPYALQATGVHDG